MSKNKNGSSAQALADEFLKVKNPSLKTDGASDAFFVSIYIDLRRS